MAGKGGKTEGAGRKPAPEPLVAMTVRLPVSQTKWLKENIKNRSNFFSSVVAKAMAETQAGQP